MLSKKIKLNLDYHQQLILNTLSNEHRLLYNYLLEKAKIKWILKNLTIIIKISEPQII